eukprot:SAG31_NODE_18_length_35375_cov_22.525315_21_plen_81_part_00
MDTRRTPIVEQPDLHNPLLSVPMPQSTACEPFLLMSLAAAVDQADAENQQRLEYRKFFQLQVHLDHILQLPTPPRNVSVL